MTAFKLLPSPLTPAPTPVWGQRRGKSFTKQYLVLLCSKDLHFLFYSVLFCFLFLFLFSVCVCVWFFCNPLNWFQELPMGPDPRVKNTGPENMKNASWPKKKKKRQANNKNTQSGVQKCGKGQIYAERCIHRYWFPYAGLIEVEIFLKKANTVLGATQTQH